MGWTRDLEQERWKHLMVAIDDLTAAVAANTTAVNNLVTAFGTVDQSPAIEAQVALLDASTKAATDAVTPPPAAQPVEPPA